MVMADTPKTPRSKPRTATGAATLSASEALKAAEAAIGTAPAKPKPTTKSVKPIDANPQAKSVKPIDTNPQAASVKPIDTNPQSAPEPEPPVVEPVEEPAAPEPDTEITESLPQEAETIEIGRAVQQECRDRSRMPSSA
eukprot:TRINITY_DN44448_c0_g1_i1.p1 TRINITY_DN44448_c0_g1~~TRINITY_DN44448_c0_g1_i1.p1  ORF type:complete len:139 (+),score=35.67 TRINITY_DN44448_c0_g1_i1:266-682(+)